MKIIPDKKEGLFALILTHHRLWGTIIVPYVIVRDLNRSYFRLSETLSSFTSEDTLAGLAQEERDIVDILNDYSERNLYRLFSKEKTVKDFMEKVTADKINRIIRPYIETRIYKCLSIARDEAVPVYLQKAKISTIHSEDRLLLHADPARPVFRFDRNQESSTYSLSLESGGKLIVLKDSAIDIICTSPCLIRENINIYFVSDIDGAKLKPFLTKDHVTIPKNAEVKYYSTFVLNAINNFRVEGTGYEISEPEPDKCAVISFSTGLGGSPVLSLEFEYSGQLLQQDDPSLFLTRFEYREGLFIFRKYRRDFEWEHRCIESF